MKVGQKVRIKIYEGELVLVVAELNDDHVNVCTPEEFEKAKKDGRKPRLVGFPVTDIISEIGS